MRRNVVQTKRRVQYRIQLTLEAKDALENVSGKFGLTQTAMISKLLNWFVDQSGIVRVLILGMIPKDLVPEIANVGLQNRV